MGAREDEIRARLFGATDGPWLAQGDYVVTLDDPEMGDPGICRLVERGTLRDGELIAHATRDLAYLLDRIEELERANGQLKLLADLPPRPVADAARPRPHDADRKRCGQPGCPHNAEPGLSLCEGCWDLANEAAGDAAGRD